jgi:iron complex outermembrane receptor protein
LTPQYLPTFNATIDYYDIKIKNVIGTYGANLILSSCVNSANPLFCSLVHRAPVTGTASDGSLWLGTQGYITDATYNLGELQQQGIDFELNYRQDLAFAGKLDFNFSGNYDLHFKTTPYVGSGTYDCAGYYGPSCGADGGVSPHIKTVFRINYSTPLPGLDFWAKWRLIGPVKVQNLSQNPLLAGPVDPIEGIGNSVPGFNYIDLGASYQVAKQVAVRFGVNNVADKDPPIIQAFYGTSVLDSGNTYPQTYDWGGRYLFANLTIDF